MSHINEILENVERLRREDLETVLNIFETYKNEKLPLDKFNGLCDFYGERGIPLPSGLYGNLLALAIELHEWEIVQTIIADGKVRSDVVASEFGGKNPISAEMGLEYQKIFSFEEDRLKIEKIIELLKVNKIVK